MAMKTLQMRKCRWFASVAVFLLAVSSSITVQATEANSFAIGRWTGQASVSDAERAFVACRARADDRANTSISLEVDRQANWSLELANQGWHLPVSRHYQLRLSVDGGPDLDWDSIANTSTVLAIKLGTDQTLLSLLRRGKTLRVASGTFDRTYDLTGSAEAVDHLTSCQKRAMSEEARGAAFYTLVGYTAATLGVAWAAAWLVPMAPAVETGIFFAVASRAILLAPPAIVLNTTGYQQSTTAPTPVLSAENGPVTARDSHPPEAAAAVPKRTEIQLRQDSGIFVAPVLINGVITLDFVVDSGAADVSIPADVVTTLMRTGTISETDSLGPQTYKMADGSTSQSETFLIRSLKLGDIELHDVIGSQTSTNGMLLLGQSFLSKFKSWSMDNTRHVLIVEAR